MSFRPTSTTTHESSHAGASPAAGPVPAIAGLRYWEQDADGRYTRVSTADSALAEGLLGRTSRQCAVPVAESGWATLEGALVWNDFVVRELDANHQPRWWSCHGEARVGDDDEVIGWHGVDRDITEQIELKRVLQLERCVANAMESQRKDTEALPEVLEALLRITDAHEVQYWSHDAHAGALHCVYSRDRKGISGAAIGARLTANGANAVDAVTRHRNDQGCGRQCCFTLDTDGTLFGVAQIDLGDGGAVPARIAVAIEQSMARLARTLLSRARNAGREPQREKYLERLLELSTDWRWRQDAQYRFTSDGDYGRARRAQSPNQADRDQADVAPASGERPWEQNWLNMSASAWAAHMGVLASRKPFRDLELCRVDDDGRRIWVSVSGAPVFGDTGKFTGYTGTSRDITERKREEQMLLLEHSVTKTLASVHGAQDPVRATLRAICEAENWSCGEYWRADEAADVLRFDAAWDRLSERVQALFAPTRKLVYHRGTGLAGRVWETGEAIWVSDCANDARMLRKTLAHDADLRGAFLFPVFVDSKVVGVLAFWSRDLRQSDEHLRNTIRLLGAQIGQILERQRAEGQLRESEERFRALTRLSSDWYWETDSLHRCTRMESSRDIDSRTRKRMLGKSPWEAGFSIDGDPGMRTYRERIARRESFRDVIMVTRSKRGKTSYLSISGEPRCGNDGEYLGYRGVSREITASRQAQERIRHLATHDVLTGLINRSMFGETLNQAVEIARSTNGSFAVLFLDLDRFKFINDALGHEAGDSLLVEMSRRFTACLRADDVVARLGGDEFVILLRDGKNEASIQKSTRKLLSAALQSVLVGGQECRVTASIGIARYPENGKDGAALMKAADTAMYQAKAEGKNNYQFFSADVRSNSLERMTLESNLRAAMERNEFTLHYQPKLDLDSGCVTGVEALLRWNNAELGSVPPMQFIPVAEELGLIVPIGKWVLEQALQQRAQWQKQGMPPVAMAVNLSVRQFSDPDLLSTVREALQCTKTPPSMLELEITESMLMQDPERAIAVLGSLRELGVRLALDDFGTGYSSLAQLKRFPINTLKVDRSFVREIEQSEEDNAITKAIISMGKVLSLTIIAEGVETAEQESFLRLQSCDEIQGFSFSRPLPPDEFARFYSDKVRPSAA